MSNFAKDLYEGLVGEFIPNEKDIEDMKEAFGPLLEEEEEMSEFMLEYTPLEPDNPAEWWDGQEKAEDDDYDDWDIEEEEED